MDSLASQSTLIGELQAKVNETPPSQRRWMFLKMNLKVVSWSSGLHRHTHTQVRLYVHCIHMKAHTCTHTYRKKAGEPERKTKRSVVLPGTLALGRRLGSLRRP